MIERGVQLTAMTSKKPLSQKREEITEMKGKSFRERGLGKSIHSAEKPVGGMDGAEEKPPVGSDD